MNEFLQQFLVESRELSDQATTGLLALEGAPRDAALLDSVFRALHTLKGGAGIVDFLAMDRAVHAAEDLLSGARTGRHALDHLAIGDCLACVDQIVQWLDVIEQTGELPPASCEAEADRIVARFRHAMDTDQHGLPGEGEFREGVATPEPAAARAARARAVLAAQLDMLGVDEPRSAGHILSAATTAANVLRHLGRAADAAQFMELAADTGSPDPLPRLQAALTRVLAGDAAQEPQTREPAGKATAHLQATNVRTLRVEAERVDALVRLTGEFTVAKNALEHLAKLAQAEGNPMAAAIKARQAQFAQLTGELQRSVLALRVLPLRVVFQRFPRLLRDIAESLGKPAQLEFSGDETEADKAIVEMLFEPLLHVLRNAVDHGIEDVALRARSGKPRVATVSMRAMRRGEHVVVEVADDGAGLDVPRIREVALRRRVVAAEDLESMSEAQVIDLVFAPGFSTASEVTAVSGRGVGMDAVRTAVERAGGRVSIDSRAGQGTTVRFMLPFSVMMTTVMSVAAGGQMFGVPLDAVVETVRVPRSALAAVGLGRAVVIRNQTVPVVDLAQMLGAPGTPHPAGDATLVIAAFAGQRCGLDVDAVGERLDVILKPLDGLLAGTPGITGTTLLGDGQVLLVLDIGELLQ